MDKVSKDGARFKNPIFQILSECVCVCVCVCDFLNTNSHFIPGPKYFSHNG